MAIPIRMESFIIKLFYFCEWYSISGIFRMKNLFLVRMFEGFKQIGIVIGVSSAIINKLGLSTVKH